MQAAWTALCVLVSLLYLTGEITKSLVAAIFVFASASLGIGSYRLAQLGLALSAVAFAVWLGFPPPARWLEIISQIAHPSAAASTG
jgi:hypothetical protein